MNIYRIFDPVNTPPPDRLPAASFAELAERINADARRDTDRLFRHLIIGIIAVPVALILAGLAIEALK